MNSRIGSFGTGYTLPIGANDKSKKNGPALAPIEKPDPKLPEVWAHPPSSTLDGKCGITGCANMLRLYGKEKDPADLDQRRYRSWGPGLRSDKFAENLTELSGKTFTSKTVDDGKPLETLRGHLKAGKPVALQYMTDSTDAHWVVATGIRDTPDGPKVQVQSWGQYYEADWKELEPAWKRGYGGPYPYVVGNDASKLLPKK
jgi:hypothetical protein